MKATIKLPKFKIPRAQGVADELEQIHFQGVNAWLAIVAEKAGGIPWTGESLGSLRPVAEFLLNHFVPGSIETNIILEDRISNRVIQSESDWNTFLGGKLPKDWRFHLTRSGQLTNQIKSPELGAASQRGHFNFTRNGNSRVFGFNFNIQIFQFIQNEEQVSLSHTSPWKAFSSAKKAYIEAVDKALNKSIFIQDLLSLKRE